MMQKRETIFIFLLALAFGFTNQTSTTPYKFPELRTFPKMPFSESNPVTVEGALLGRYLFYDPILSSDGTMSCASCHQQSAAFSDAPNTYSKGRGGALMKRNTPPLFNLAWHPTFFWDGRAPSLEQQVFHPLGAKDEMNLDLNMAVERLNQHPNYPILFRQAFGAGEIDSVQIGNAIAQFLRTLISYQSKYDKALSGKARFTKEEYEGFVLVNDQTKGDCLHCHTTDANGLGSTMTFSNNGLDSFSNVQDFPDLGRGAVTGKPSDNGKFFIPSLRNIALTAPYMHDGRFKTLSEVIDFYSEGVHLCANLDSKMQHAHQGGVRLNAEEKQKVLAFLLTMTDSSFVGSEEFGNPF